MYTMQMKDTTAAPKALRTGHRVRSEGAIFFSEGEEEFPRGGEGGGGKGVSFGRRSGVTCGLGDPNPSSCSRKIQSKLIIITREIA